MHPNFLTVVYATMSMKLSTELMKVISWKKTLGKDFEELLYLMGDKTEVTTAELDTCIWIIRSQVDGNLVVDFDKAMAEDKNNVLQIITALRRFYQEQIASEISQVKAIVDAILAKKTN